MKLNNGDTVAVVLPNSPEFPVAIFGVMAAGGIVTPVNPVYTPCKFHYYNVFILKASLHMLKFQSIDIKNDLGELRFLQL